MCRLLGAVFSEATDYKFTLYTAPRSLAKLSHEHPDGWGLAVHDAGRGWTLSKHPACAGVDERVQDAAATAHGQMLVAHVRKRTVGPIRLENTHPFRRGPWVFAHNGTVAEVAWVVARTSTERLAQIEGSTDSEVLFAYLLAAIDRSPSPGELDAALQEATREALSVPAFGSANFLLSNGSVL